MTNRWVVRVFARGAAGRTWYTVLPTYPTWQQAYAKADQMLRKPNAHDDHWKGRL